MNVENLLKYLDVTNVILTVDTQQTIIKPDQEHLETSTKGETVFSYQGRVEEEEEEENAENEDIIDPKTYGHLLTWISFVNKLNTPETNEQHELVKKALKLYLDEHKHIHKNFLTVLF